MEKRCFRCLCVKPIDEFYRHAMMGDGHLNKCRICAKADGKTHRLANLDSIRAYDIRRSAMPHRIALRKRITATWAASFPERKKAQTAVGNAIRDGRLKPWPVCAMPECSLKPEAHHYDYSTPLDVVWLCRAHHMQAHALTQELETA